MPTNANAIWMAMPALLTNQRATDYDMSLF